MNIPIINPFYVYLAGVCPTLGVMLTVFGSIGLVISFITAMATWMDCGIDLTSEEDKALLAKIKKIITTSLIVTIIGIMIPGESTIYGMIAASYTTPANIETLGDTAKDTIDYLFDKINEVKEEKKS